jgi:hypothetical protein
VSFSLSLYPVSTDHGWGSDNMRAAS